MGGVNSFLHHLNILVCLSSVRQPPPTCFLTGCCFLTLASWAMVARGLHCSNQEAETGGKAMSWRPCVKDCNPPSPQKILLWINEKVNLERTGKATPGWLHSHCAVGAACRHCPHISVRCCPSSFLVCVVVSTLLRWTRQYQISGY